MSVKLTSQKGEKAADEALKRTPKQLLAEMLSVDIAADDRRLYSTFAALLTVLAEQASKDARRIVCLTWALAGLTFVLLVVALAQCSR